MNLMELFVKIGVDDQASSKVQQISNTIGKGLSSAASLGTSAVSGTAKMIGNTLATAAKVGAAAIGAVSTAVVKLGKDAIESYADYEQLIGGVETLFKDSAELVEEYADRAYITAGRSANEYMETVTSFSARLLQSLEGDTKAAAELADLAMQDMADNANKMGTDFTMIQNAYQAFAKNNWTLLDNLKLGYGGTAREMARLVNESGLLSEAQKINLDDTKNLGIALQEVGFDTIINAIHAVQVELGITGTTALEASKTISGSANAMKASWKNLLTAIASNNKDIKKNVKEFTESVGTFADNLLPRIDAALDGLGMLVTELEPTLDGALGMAMDKLFTALPQMVNIGSNLVSTLVNAIDTNKDKLSEAAVALVTAIKGFVTEEAPRLVSSGLELLMSLLKGFANPPKEETGKSVGQAINSILDSILKFTEEMQEPGKKLIENLAEGFDLYDMGTKIGEIIANIANFILDNAPTIVDKGFELLGGLITGLTSEKNIDTFVTNFTNFVKYLAQKITDNKEEIVGGVTSILERFGKALEENKTIEEIINGVTSVVLALVDELGKEKNTEKIRGTGNTIVKAVGEGISTAAPNLLAYVPTLLQNIIDFLLNEDTLSMLVEVGVQLAGAILSGLARAVAGGIFDAVKGPLEYTLASFIGSEAASDYIGKVEEGLKTDSQRQQEMKDMWSEQQEKSHQEMLDQIEQMKKDAAEALATSDIVASTYGKNTSVVVNQYITSDTKSAADLEEEAMYEAQQKLLNSLAGIS